ncbi:MAG: ATP-binding cassette domain-containing protein [Thiohalocapsa sp.]|jgi:peptide/nickel transport system ATP-binding protein
MRPPLLQALGIEKRYRPGGWGHARGTSQAVAGVDLCVAAGESVGLVGESGSGKTTLARICAGMSRRDGGRLLWRGRAIEGLDRASVGEFRREVQYVFQSPVDSLNPRHRVGRIFERTVRALTGLDRVARAARIGEIIERVGLDRTLLGCFPHQLSGGQAQRVAIARALLGRPRLVILDEPVSALDVSLQAQILSLLDALRSEQGLAYLFISHDLAVVERLCGRIAVMRDGRIIEQGAPERILTAPAAGYTRRLLAAVPRLRGP